MPEPKYDKFEEKKEKSKMTLLPEDMKKGILNLPAIPYLTTPHHPIPYHTWGHEEGYPEPAGQHAVPQRLEAGAVEGEGAAHQHVQHHAQALQRGGFTRGAFSVRASNKPSLSCIITEKAFTRD